MLGGSLTRFRTDEADQEGAGVLKDMFKAGWKGAISTRNPLKLPSNTLGGLKAGLKCGVKRKAEAALKKKLIKKLNKCYKTKTSNRRCKLPISCFPNK